MEIQTEPRESPGRRGVMRGVLLFTVVFMVCDVGAAQIVRRVLPVWKFESRGVVERQYRVRSPLYHHDLKPLVDVMTVWGKITYRLSTNSLGFLDMAAREVPLRSDQPRVLFIGDSFTEGLGVPYESTFVGRIAREWESRGVEVLNAGVAGYSPAIYYRKIKYWLDERRLQVSTIVVCIDISDIYDEARQYQLSDDDRVEGLPTPTHSKLTRLKQFLKENSVLVRVLDAGRDVIGNRKRYALGEDVARWPLSKALFDSYGRLGLVSARANMDRLISVARGHGIPVAIVVYPWPDQIADRDLKSLQVSFWATWARNSGVTFIDLFPAFIGTGDARETIRQNFIPHDYHWNATGHRTVADAILRSGLLPLPVPVSGEMSARKPLH